MDNPSYVSLSRQSGLMRELSVIANNIANINTAGFKRESAVFSEYVHALGSPGSASPMDSLSMGRLGAHHSDFAPGGLQKTGGQLDIAIDGPGFFEVQTPAGPRLTRAGHFMTDANGTLMTPEGFALSGNGGGPITLPPNASLIQIAEDGTISDNGVVIDQVGIFTADRQTLARDGANMWRAEGAVDPIENPSLRQGFVENSNVDPMSEMARMIVVQRHYEAGNSLLEQEHQRIQSVITALRQMG